MSKKKMSVLLLLILTIIILGGIGLTKSFEKKLGQLFYREAVKNGIPENQIRKTNLSYFSKGNRYEYDIYLDGVDDEKYFNYYTLLPKSRAKLVVTQDFSAIKIETSASINGSVVGLEDELAQPLLEEIK